MTANWKENRHNEKYTFTRVAWENFQEHEEYSYITGGSIELATDAELKATGTFDFEGTSIPDVNDLVRVYYSFEDDSGECAYVAIATFLVSYAELSYTDTLKGIVASGSLDGSSVLKVLQDKKAGAPYTISKNSNAVITAQNIVTGCGLNVDSEASSFALTVDHTFDAGTSYLEIVNWLLDSAGFCEGYPDENGTVVMKPYTESYQRTDYIVFENNEESIMYPEIEQENNWQETPNAVRLMFSADDACAIAAAVNTTGSRCSLDARGGREITYFEEVDEFSSLPKLQALAEETLKQQSCDIEYVTFSHAYIPVQIYDPVKIRYSSLEWIGNADNISIDLSPSTKTQLKIKKTVYKDIVVQSSAEVLR